MAIKRPRTQRRVDERAARRLVQDRERLWALSPGGAAARPMTIASPTVIEARVGSMRCVQCDGEYAIRDHEAAGDGQRKVSVRCRLCHVGRDIWFKLGSSAPS